MQRHRQLESSASSRNTLQGPLYMRELRPPLHQWDSYLCLSTEEVRGCALLAVDAMFVAPVNQSSRAQSRPDERCTTPDRALPGVFTQAQPAARLRLRRHRSRRPYRGWRGRGLLPERKGAALPARWLQLRSRQRIGFPVEVPVQCALEQWLTWGDGREQRHR